MSHERRYHKVNYKPVLWRPDFGRCTLFPHKRAYPTKKQALRAMHVYGGSWYKCKDCGKHHLTSYPPKVQAAIRMLLESLRDDRAKGVKA